MVAHWKQCAIVGNPARLPEKTMFQKEYARKPSFVQINCAVRDAKAKGENWIQLVWGENQITLERTAWGWDGHGWIGKTGGYDIAQKLNRNGA